VDAAPGASHGPARVRLPQRPMGSRLSFGHVATIIAGLLAAVLSYAALRSGSNVEVALARGPLQAHQVVHSGSFRFEAMELPESAPQGFLTRKELARYEGGTILVSVPKGAVVTTAMLEKKGEAKPLEVPVPVEAVPTALAVGDLVDLGVPTARAGDEPLILRAQVTWIDAKPLAPTVSVNLSDESWRRFLTAPASAKWRVAIVRGARPAGATGG
jgi:hypothetical protein